MSIFEDSQTLLYVCTIANGYSDTNAWTAAGQPSGSGVFVKVSDNTVEKGAMVAGTEYRFIWKDSGGTVHYSPIFTSATVKNALSVDDEALVEQITYLGYNGTSGSMDAANSTYYGLQIILNHTFGMLNNSPLILTVPYKSDSTATQGEVAAGLAIEATKVMKRNNSCIKVERVNSGAVSNALGTATGSVVNGGNTVVFSEDMTALVVAGTILRLGGIGAGVTPCYIVTGVTGAAAAAIYTLDQPYQGATNAALAANLIESVTEGNWGIKFTGVSVTDANFNPDTDEPFVVSFELGVRDFETATVTYSTKPVIGTGTYQQVRKLEAYARFQGRDRVVSAYPIVRPNYTYQAVAGETYVIHSFEIWDEKFVDTTTGIHPKSPTRIVIAVDDDFDGTDVFYTVLGTTNITALI